MICKNITYIQFFPFQITFEPVNIRPGGKRCHDKDVTIRSALPLLSAGAGSRKPEDARRSHSAGACLSAGAGIYSGQPVTCLPACLYTGTGISPRLPFASSSAPNGAGYTKTLRYQRPRFNWQTLCESLFLPDKSVFP